MEQLVEPFRTDDWGMTNLHVRVKNVTTVGSSNREICGFDDIRSVTTSVLAASVTLSHLHHAPLYVLSAIAFTANGTCAIAKSSLSGQ